MKKLVFVMMMMLMSINASSFAGTTILQEENERVQKLVIPANIIIKQIITFKDGSSIEVFYQKEGKTCRMYSKTDVLKYSSSDLNRVKSTNFEITDHVEGKCRMTKSTSNVLKLARSLFQFLR